MSVEVLLIPLGIAAYSAVHSLVREARSADLCEKCKATRITDDGVLGNALAGTGAAVTSAAPHRLQASSRCGSLTFQRVGDVFLGRVDGADEETTRAMLGELDAAVGLVMQDRTARLVVERAQALGFRLIEHREQDGSLNYVFEEI